MGDKWGEYRVFCCGIGAEKRCFFDVLGSAGILREMGFLRGFVGVGELGEPFLAVFGP
jgi:hypothetical protein